VLVRINFDGDGFAAALRKTALELEKVRSPGRARRRYADTMAGNGHLWKNR
jgi:hypothetical protein